MKTHIALTVFALVTLLHSPAQAASEELTQRVNLISEKIANTLKVVRLNSADHSHDHHRCHNCVYKKEERHLYVKAVDLEHNLVRFIAMHGIPIKSVNAGKNILHKTKDLAYVLDSITFKIDILATINNIKIPSQNISSNVKNFDQAYVMLDRMDQLLSTLGSPPVVPQDVLTRTELIENIVQQLFTFHPDTPIEHLSMEEIDIKTPLDTFHEAEMLIIDLSKMVKKSSQNVAMAFPSHEASITTNKHVFDLTGLILMDLMAYAEEKEIKLTLSDAPKTPNASPSYVWRTLYQTRQLLNYASM